MTTLIRNIPEQYFFRLALRQNFVVKRVPEVPNWQVLRRVLVEKTQAKRMLTSLVPRHRSRSDGLHAPTVYSSNLLKPGWLRSKRHCVQSTEAMV